MAPWAGYFEKADGAVQEWIFSSLPREVGEDFRPFKVPRFIRTLSDWLNLLIAAGFVLERFGEPYPDDGVVRTRPRLQNAQVVAYFLQVRARKPA